MVDNFLLIVYNYELQPRDVTKFNRGGVPKRSKGADCKSVGSAFDGSNPSSSTKVKGNYLIR